MPIPQLNYTPAVIVDTTGLTEAEWLEYRRTGIGGSDASAVLGVSPFTTCRDLYYDKLRIVSAIDDEDNWVQKAVGHLLEDLVAQIFHIRTGYRIYQIKKMFRHPLYPFMIADVDFFVELPDGTTAILEIKTTNYNAKNKWWDNKKKIIPLNYELQGRHYMAVMNLDRVYYCCLYGNSEEEVIIRHIDRDLAYESELIALEENFWVNHVLAQVPPPYTENGDLILKSVHRHFGAADPQTPEMVLSKRCSAEIARYLELQQIKSELEVHVKSLGEQMTKIKGIIADEMGKRCSASCVIDGVNYAITFNPVPKPVIDKKNLAKLEIQYPEVYKQFVTVSESRRFNVKPKSAKKEAA